MKESIKLQNYYKSLSEFDDHNSVVFIYNKKAKLHGFIAFHRGGFDTPSFGATRFLEYANEADALRDVLRLSRLMSYKNALAGLPYGGAKAVLIKFKNYDMSQKNILLGEYAKHISRLHGAFITGTDVGLDINDLKVLSSKSKNFVGMINNPEKATAQGLYYSMETVGKYINGGPTVDGMSFAIQGLGKVGEEILSLVYGKASTIYVSEINKKTLKRVKKKYPQIVVVHTNKILQQKVDIFCPCALSNVLNSRSISQIKAKAIVGSANNQLKSLAVGEILHRLGVLYCPDYVVNAGGLIAVADEYKNKKPGGKNLDKKLRDIGKRIDRILSLSKKKNKSPAVIAEEMAQRIFNRRK